MQPNKGVVATPSREPWPRLCPGEPCLTSSVLTFLKRCLTGFVRTVFVYECHACLGSVFYFFPHQSTQGYKVIYSSGELKLL